MNISSRPPQLARILGERKRLYVNNPFTIKHTLIISLILSVTLAVSVTFDNMRFLEPGAPIATQFFVELCHYLALSFLVLGACSLYYRRCMELIKPSGNTTSFIVGASVSSLIIAFGCSMLSHLIRIKLFPELGFDSIVDISSVNDLLLGASELLLQTLILTLTRSHQMVLEHEQLQTEQLQTHFMALEQQMNPHFLFNSLNTLNGLIGTDDDAAQSYLQQLASAYRYVLQQQNNQSVTLEQELAFVDSMAKMMQTRYGHNLQIVQHIAPALLQHRLPPISIQLLLENAIKHNVISERHPLTITIETTDDPAIQVSNPLQPKMEAPQSQSTHLGLKNLEQRYDMLYHQTITIEKSDTQFVVQLPLNTNES